MWIIVIILIAVIVATNAPKANNGYRPRQGSSKQTHQTKQPAETVSEQSEHKDYTHHYQKKFLLTRNEYQAYKSLKIILDKYQMIVCPKVRLLDIIEPINGDHYKGALGKIQSKHVDFVICDKNLYVQGILELDDNSHNLPERQERDQFVDAALRNVGYKVIRVRYVTEETIKELLPKITQQ